MSYRRRCRAMAGGPRSPTTARYGRRPLSPIARATCNRKSCDFNHIFGPNGAALSARHRIMNSRFTDRSRPVGAQWRDVIRRALTTVDAMSPLVRLPLLAALVLATHAATAQGPQSLAPSSPSRAPLAAADIVFIDCVTWGVNESTVAEYHA